MRCPFCNARIEDDSVFCTACGKKLKAAQEVGLEAKERVITVGRAQDNSIVINNRNVSSHHAKFVVQSNCIMLEDCGSTNGIYVNGRKIIICKVKRNDEIKFSKKYTFNWNDLERVLKGKKNLDIKEFPNHEISPSWITQKEVISIGRNPENDIVINNIKISRHHAILEEKDGEWFIEDLKSSNGTYLNGRKIKKSKVSREDLITIGGIPIDFRSLFEEKPEISGDIKISAKNLTFSIGKKIIIDDITLTFLPGEFIGLIGPSGSGKTTLMLMMNGVLKPERGEVFINNQSLFAEFNSFRGLIGYVPQDDIIHRELKVEESLKFTAKLRFDKKYSSSEIRKQVDNVIEMLGLDKARNTLIGSVDKKGISGGQRKRVNLGQELLTEPSLLFLDEPTSGLDPKTDTDVMLLLKGIADKGKIVVLTTHHITRDNFKILTHLVVLTEGGKLAYFGPAQKATSYFGAGDPQEIFDILKSKTPDFFKEKYRASDYCKNYIDSRSTEKSARKVGKSFEKIERRADLRQFFILTSRYLLIKLRDRMSTLILLAQAPIIALLIALVFKSSEKSEKYSALFVLVVAAIWLGCSNAAREIVSEQAIYRRERMVNLKIPSYLWSKISVLAIVCIIQCMILSIIPIQTLDLDVKFYELFILLLTTSLAALSTGLFLSTLVDTNEAAMGLTPIILIPQVILAGLIVRFAHMNTAIKAMSGLMISRWSFEASLIGEYKNTNQEEIINSIGFNPGNIALDFFIIALFYSTFFGLTALFLKRKDVK